MTSKLLIEHLTIVLCAICIAIVVGLFLGVIAYLFPKARKVILNLADLLQTIPSLAMLGLIMIVIGAGKQTVIIGLALYSLLPIIRNTVLGLTEVSPAIKEAAMGCGHDQVPVPVPGGTSHGLPGGIHRHPDRHCKLHQYRCLCHLRGRRRHWFGNLPWHPAFRIWA